MIEYLKNKKQISILIIFLINFLFALKYSVRYTKWGLVISLFYLAFLLWGYYKISLFSLNKQTSRFILLASSAVYLISCLFLLKYIDAESLNVDRWSVISSFWHEAYQGNYPYAAVSHMGNHPGPLPFYFIISWPFLLLGDIGYFTLFGIIVFILFSWAKNPENNTLVLLFILFTSMAVLWEIIARSTIFTNSVLFVFCIYYILNTNLTDKKHLVFSAILTGLALSTRTIFVFPLIIYFIYTIRRKEYKLGLIILWSVLAGFTFIFSFLPFILFYFNDFLKLNPFTVQSGQLFPLYLTPLLLLISIFIGFKIKSKLDIHYYTGIVFIFIFIIYFFFVASITSVKEAFLQNQADISYLIFAIPFLAYYVYAKSKKLNMN